MSGLQLKNSKISKNEEKIIIQIYPTNHSIFTKTLVIYNPVKSKNEIIEYTIASGKVGDEYGFLLRGLL
jgi:hypothetical protein